MLSRGKLTVAHVVHPGKHILTISYCRLAVFTVDFTRAAYLREVHRCADNFIMLCLLPFGVIGYKFLSYYATRLPCSADEFCLLFIGF